ncbi:MAG TPA: sodium ion-translocating decarboxylase subunit beta [Bacteroidales bacterium]|nr:sodium ion-translocating decarboxylase subunit beta [Bacteroidales bacterium]
MDTLQTLAGLWEDTGFHNANWGNLVMIIVGIALIVLALRYNFKPLLLIPLGMGVILGNIPFLHEAAYHPGIYQEGSVMNYLFGGILKGIYPALIFLGLGAMTDLSPLIANPKLILLGAAAQVGIFATFLGAVVLGFPMPESAAIAIIGGTDGNTAIFLTSQLAGGLQATGNGMAVQNLIGPIAIAAYIYMSLVPVIQPPIMKLLTTKKERLIRMKPARTVSKTEKILFPLTALLLSAFVAPASLPLLGMFFVGNVLRESGMTKQLAATASTVLIDIVLILIGLTVGASTQADVFLKWQSILIFVLGALAFMVATAGGIIFAKVMNLFLSKENRINPLVGAAGVAAVPDSARIAHETGLKEDPTNHLIGHAMAPNIAGLIGSAITAGLFLGFIL